MTIFQKSIPSNLKVVYLCSQYNHFRSRTKQGLACCFMAFGFSYIYPEIEWSTQIMNEILIEGNQLYLDSTDDGTAPNPILKKFHIKDVTLELTLSDPDVIGTLESYDQRVCDIVQGLRMFFRYNKAGIFQCEDLEMLIWRKGPFFIYDSNGRTSRAERDMLEGRSALISLVKIENLIYFILNICGLGNRSPFQITCIKMIKLFRVTHDSDEGEPPKMTNFRECDWEVKEKSHAILFGKYHIGDRLWGDYRNKQSLPVSIMCMVYSKIDPPNTWTKKILHKVLYLGNKLYRECINRNGPAMQVSIKDLPGIFNIGQFQAKIAIQPFIYNCILERNSRDAQKFIINYFNKKQYMLVQLKGASFGVYEKHGVFYMFDGFKRDKNGCIAGEKCGAACLHMFSVLNDLCRLLFKNLIQLAPEDSFYIHGFEIIDIDENENLGEQILNNYKAGEKKVDDDFEADIVSREESVDENLPQRGVCYDPKDLTIMNLNSPGISRTQFDVVWDEVKKEVTEYEEEEIYDDDSDDSDGTVVPITSFLSPSDMIVDNGPPKKKRPKTSRPSAIEICNDMFDEVYMVFNEYIQEIEDEIYGENDDEDEPISKKKSRGPPKAKQILVKSDLEYLRSMKGRLKDGEDVDFSAKEIVRKIPTLHEELQMPHNFELMPDRSQILFGNKCVDDLTFTFSVDQMNALVGIGALISSYKYSIATWDPAIIDFTLDLAVALGKNIPINQSVLYSAARFHFGAVKVGKKTFDITLKNIATGVFGNLKKILETVFEQYDRVVIITTCDSFAVFKRFNFYYLYEGYPCDVVGFRMKEGGKACFMRFMDLSPMIRRIEANRMGCTKTHRIGLSSIQMQEIYDKTVTRYEDMTKSKEDLLIAETEAAETLKEQKRLDKIDAINEKIEAEKERIKKFRAEKYPTGQFPKALDVDDERDIEDDKVLKHKKKTDTSMWKHKKGTTLSTNDPTYVNQVHCLSEIGYLRRDQDHLYKIQGSFSLPNRAEIIHREIKSCYYVAIYAIIYVIHHPVITQNYRKVDTILENGLNMWNKIGSREVCKKRYLRKIMVDNFLYNLVIKEYEIHNPFSRLTLEIALDTFFQQKKYLMLQYENCTFVIFKDDLFHIFDPYATLEVRAGEKIDTDDATELDENEKVWPDRDTASWVLFPELSKVINYISKRLTNPSGLNNNYIMMTVNILNYEKAPKQSSFAQYLTVEAAPTRKRPCKGPELLDFEEILWVENLSKIPWSRLEDSNVVGMKRNTINSKYKEFDIEIPNELYSLWGTMHPRNKMFSRRSRGKQYLANCVVVCMMANLYKLDEWNPELMDEIIRNGDWYFNESTKDISLEDYEVSVEDMNTSYQFNSFQFKINIQLHVAGIVYDSRLDEFNVARALPYFFEKYTYGILQSHGKILAFGKGTFGYFMYDSETRGPPVFEPGMGAPYILKCTTLKRLLHSIIMTLQIIYHRVEFTMHGVELQMSKTEPRPILPLTKPLEDSTVAVKTEWEDLLADTVEKIQNME